MCVNCLHFWYISYVQKLLMWNYEAPEGRGPGAGAPPAPLLIRHWSNGLTERPTELLHSISMTLCIAKNNDYISLLLITDGLRYAQRYTQHSASRIDLNLTATYVRQTRWLRRGKGLCFSWSKREQWRIGTSDWSVRTWRWRPRQLSPSHWTDHRSCIGTCRLEGFLTGRRSSARSGSCPSHFLHRESRNDAKCNITDGQYRPTKEKCTKRIITSSKWNIDIRLILLMWGVM